MFLNYYSIRSQVMSALLLLFVMIVCDHFFGASLDLTHHYIYLVITSHSGHETHFRLSSRPRYAERGFTSVTFRCGWYLHKRRARQWAWGDASFREMCRSVWYVRNTHIENHIPTSSVPKPSCLLLTLPAKETLIPTGWFTNCSRIIQNFFQNHTPLK